MEGREVEGEREGGGGRGDLLTMAAVPCASVGSSGSAAPERERCVSA